MFDLLCTKMMYANSLRAVCFLFDLLQKRVIKRQIWHSWTHQSFPKAFEWSFKSNQDAIVVETRTYISISELGITSLALKMSKVLVVAYWGASFTVLCPKSCESFKVSISYIGAMEKKIRQHSVQSKQNPWIIFLENDIKKSLLHTTGIWKIQSLSKALVTLHLCPKRFRMHTGKKQERKKTIRKSVSSCITLQSAQSAEIRTLFLAYSRDLRRQKTARWREARWCKEDTFQASRGEVCVCVLWICFYLLNLSKMNEVLHPIASLPSHSRFDLLNLLLWLWILSCAVI